MKNQKNTDFPDVETDYESSLIPYTATVALPQGHVLILAPHPDDEVFGCAGAIMRHVAQGDSVTVIIVTDGRAAKLPVGIQNVSDYIAIRQQESLQAAKILGYGIPQFWGLIDRKLAYRKDLIDKLVQTINLSGITQVYVPSVMEIHPDHYALALIVAETVRRCGQKVSLVMYEIGVPLYPNRLLDITDLWERKQQALECFVSQQAIQNYSRHIYGLNQYRTYTLPASVLVAEAYYVVDGETLITHPAALFGKGRQTMVLEQAYLKVSEFEKRLAFT